METIRSAGYTVHFEAASFGGLKKFLAPAKYSSIFILCDENVSTACLPLLVKKMPKLRVAEVLMIGSGEENKTIETVVNLWNELSSSNADRKALMINLGGGVISDLGGFAASTYKRGIDFINVPTTLLSMADASVGGKTGIDFGTYKNHIGTFAQPKGVYIFPDFLKTLDKRQLHNGYAEIIKAALIADKKMWKQIARITSLNPKILLPLIKRSVSIKNKIVVKDPFEKNIRRSLNFGHTIGHAVESFFLSKKNSLLHGEAIAMGMLCEAYLSFKKKMLTRNEMQEIINLIFDYFPKVKISEKDFLVIMALMQHDKKNSKGRINFTLLNGIGKCKIDMNCSSMQILESLTFYTSL